MSIVYTMFVVFAFGCLVFATILGSMILGSKKSYVEAERVYSQGRILLVIEFLVLFFSLIQIWG